MKKIVILLVALFCAALLQSEFIQTIAQETQYETVKVIGKVFLPDGTPAARYEVDVDYQLPNRIASHGGMVPVNEKGEYSCEIPIGMWMVAMVKNKDKSPGWLSDGLASPIISNIVTKELDAKYYDIHLQKGIPVAGTLHYADGTPAVGKTVFIEMFGFDGNSIPFLVKNEYGRNSYTRPSCYQHVYTDKNGNYTLWLLPYQEYELTIEDLPSKEYRQMPLKLTNEKSKTLDFILPQPTQMRFVSPDGKPLMNVMVKIDSRMQEASRPADDRQQVQFQSDSQGQVSAILSSIANLISVRTKDGKWGTNIVVQGDHAKEMTIVLNAPVVGKVRFVEKGSDKPITGRKLCYIPMKKLNDHLLLINGNKPEEVTTDKNGVATLSFMYPGADYSLYDGYRDIPEISDVDFQPQQPGTVLDLGTIEVLPKF